MKGFRNTACGLAWSGLLALAGCGGSPGGIDTVIAAPASPSGAPATQAPTGNWIDPNTGSVLLIPSSGLTYGVLQTDGVTDIIRGELAFSGNEVPSSAFVALAVTGERNARLLSLAGALQPSGVLGLTVTDPKGPGGPITAVVDTAYQPPPDLAQWAGTYTGLVQSAGLQSECDIRIDASGGFTLTNTSNPGEFDCSGTGQLAEVADVASLKSVKLCWANSPCNLTDQPSYEGLAQLAPSAPSPSGPKPSLTMVGMDPDGAQPLLVQARP
jgi:hypothetical protein